MSEAHAELVPGLAYTSLMCTAGGPPSAMSSGLDSGLSDCTADKFSIAIVGDLHLEQKGMKTFHRARQQLKDVLSASSSGEPRVVQLGDLGGYSEKPGEGSIFRIDLGNPWHPALWSSHATGPLLHLRFCSWVTWAATARTLARIAGTSTPSMQALA